jgi:hypothetical protein
MLQISVSQSDWDDLEFGFMRLLQQGKARVELKDGTACKQVFACEWFHDGGPMACAGGMAFFLRDGLQFFQVMTWIS